ncbi:MAG: hypothetical protein AAGG68_25705 [Bacteroidota bacterium]
MNTLLSKLPQLSAKNYRFLLQVLGHAFFGILILWSIIFYKERMLHFDSAYYTFNLLYHQDFYIAHGRTISYASQWMPLLAMKLGCSLKVILIVYSMSFMLLFYGIYNLIVYGFKNVEGGIFLALAVSLTVRYKFYAGISEVFFSLTLAALLIGWLTKNRDQFYRLTSWQNLLIGMLLVLVLTTGHPIIILPVLSFFAFDICYNKRWKDWYNWGLIGFAVSIFYYRFSKIQGDTGSYESNRFNNAFANLEEFSGLFELRVWEIIQWYFETQYTFPVIICAICIIILIARKKILSSLVILLSVVALLAMILVTYSYLSGRIYAMIDGYIGLIGVVLSMPIFYVILKSKQHFLSVLIITFLLAFNLHRIYGKRDFFQKRQSYIEEIIEKNTQLNQRKLVLRMQDFIWDQFWYPWALPYETLLYSSIKHPENAATIYMAEWNEGEDKWGKLQEVLPGDGRKIKNLPTKYFKLDENKPGLITEFPSNYR